MADKIITHSRWQQAQVVEQQYWQRVRDDTLEFMRILYEKYRFLDVIANNCPIALNPPSDRRGEALEIGIGSLGIGVASLLEPFGAWKITGIDPQPRVTPGNLPAPLLAFYERLMQGNLTYIEGGAENLPFPNQSFDLAACYNVLDHTHNPFAIVREVHRVLRPGGFFLLGLDALSLASWVRHKLFINDIAHPYKFLAWQVERLLPDHGFQLLYFSKDRKEWRHRLVAKARRLIAVGRKPEDTKN